MFPFSFYTYPVIVWYIIIMYMYIFIFNMNIINIKQTTTSYLAIFYNILSILLMLTVCFVCVYQCIHFKILNSHKCWPGNHIFRVLWILWSQIFKLNYFYVKFGLYSHFTRHAISISHYRYLVYSNKRPKGFNDHLSTKHPPPPQLPMPNPEQCNQTLGSFSLEIIFHYIKTIH